MWQLLSVDVISLKMYSVRMLDWEKCWMARDDWREVMLEGCCLKRVRQLMTSRMDCVPEGDW